MKKADRLKQMKLVAQQEELENMKKKVAEAGLGFVETDMPREDISEREVRRTIVTSLLSMIPYTQAYYESRAAEEEMDDLRKIKIERVKAGDLLSMAKMGRHDEALDKMMSETNYDFFYFNKLKTKMIAEGKYKFDDSTLINPFAHLEKGNRLRNAFNENYNLLGDAMSSELARLSMSPSGKFNPLGEECLWRGKNKSNVALQCTNSRIKIKKLKGSKGPDSLQWCCFHVPYCIGEVHTTVGASGEKVAIHTPNAEGLCSQCYMMKTKKKPMGMTTESAPGVIAVSVAKAGQSAKSQKFSQSVKAPTKYVKKNKREGLCTWHPSATNEAMRMYECNNTFFLNPITKSTMNVCAWHLTQCVLSHPPGFSAVITKPNELGLCAMHYLARMGHPVEETPFPYPGMKVKRAENFWKSAIGGRGHHWAAPRSEPLPNIFVRDYVEPVKPVEFYQQMVAASKYMAYKRKFKRESKRSARIVQQWFRRYRVQNAHTEKWYEQRKIIRFKAAIKIQTHMRRFLRSKFMDAQRVRYNAAALVIERCWRGFWCRKLLNIDWAARKIAKFMKKLHFLKFRDAVIMIMQLRLLAKKQHSLSTLIQRVWRGYSTRVWVFNQRLWNFVCLMSARKIQRWYKREKERKSRVQFKFPTEAETLKRCATKLSRMILELWLDRNRRVLLANAMSESAPAIQKVIRAFLAKSGAQKMRFLRKQMRSWFKPLFAGEFMEKLLNNKLYAATQVTEVKAPVQVAPVQQDHIRLFLPETHKTRFEVDKKIFDVALNAWYHYKCVPLVQSEKQAIKRKFKNPMNGNIFITLLDKFISEHRIPCRKHGRLVCGDCVVRKDCMIPTCKCKCYVCSEENKKSICVTCNHPGTLHLLLPLQAVEKAGVNENAVLLKVMTAERLPDMSMPTDIEGVEADKVIIKPKHPDDIRMEIMNHQKTAKLKRSFQVATAKWPLRQAISAGEVVGENIAENREYWKQGLNSVVNLADLKEKEAKGVEVFVYEEVAFDNHPPDYEHASSDFWNTTAKNPVKRPRDYHEKFDHNMPVPIVSNGELVYTFEGAAIYFNLLNQIIAMEKKVHHDDPDFLRLVVDHVQIFERHWRKMVVDIRQGKLDRNVQISHDSRMIFESTNLPRPALATKLDATFRLLGFHKKVLGKDIVIQAYAPLRHPPKVDLFRNPRRKGSDPLRKTTPLTDSRALSSSQPLHTAERPSGSPPRTLASAGRSASFSLTANETKRPSSSRGLHADLSATFTAAATAKAADTSPPKSRSSSRKSRRDTLLALGQNFLANTEAANAAAEAASRPGTQQLKRRGSHSDAQRDASKKVLDEIFYEMDTAARDTYKHTLQVDGDHFVCPFPACGKSFHSREAAFRHLPDHEQRTRLHAPTPLPDSHLTFYWPQGVPWVAGKKYTQRSIPPGSLKCPHPGCMEVLQNQAKLDNHMKLVHNKVGDSSYAMGYFKFEGEGMCVPPNIPQPENIPVNFCHLHALPIGKCHTCVEIESHPGPKPPFKFFDSMSIDFKAKHSLLQMNSGEPAQPADLRAHSKVVITKDEWNLGVFINLDMNPERTTVATAAEKTECRARPIAMLLDRNKDGWMAVELLYNYNEAVTRGLPVPADLHKRYELIQPILAEYLDMTEEQIIKKFFRWVPMADVIKTFHLRKMTKENIDKSLADSHVSKINTFYVRHY